jgi:hypothetical protein
MQWYHDALIHYQCLILNILKLLIRLIQLLARSAAVHPKSRTIRQLAVMRSYSTTIPLPVNIPFFLGWVRAPEI